MRLTRAHPSRTGEQGGAVQHVVVIEDSLAGLACRRRSPATARRGATARRVVGR
jgi:hypothetical protein